MSLHNGDVETLGQLVARLREDRELTQVQLAARAGVDQVTIARMEQGRGPGWWRKTSKAVFHALAEHTPIDSVDAEKFFALSKYRPADDLIERDIAEGRIVVGKRVAKLQPPPADLLDLLNKMLYSFGEHRVRALLRTMLSLAIDSEPASKAPTAVAAVAIDFEDPSSGLRGKMYTPVDPPPGSPSATSRRRKSG